MISEDLMDHGICCEMFWWWLRYNCLRKITNNVLRSHKAKWRRLHNDSVPVNKRLTLCSLSDCVSCILSSWLEHKCRISPILPRGRLVTDNPAIWSVFLCDISFRFGAWEERTDTEPSVVMLKTNRWSFSLMPDMAGVSKVYYETRQQHIKNISMSLSNTRFRHLQLNLLPQILNGTY